MNSLFVHMHADNHASGGIVLLTNIYIGLYPIECMEYNHLILWSGQESYSHEHTWAKVKFILYVVFFAENGYN